MLDARIIKDLNTNRQKLTSSGELPSRERLEQHYAAFRERFGPSVLRGLDGEKLLVTMHGLFRDNRDTMAYWLEFKNDDEFPAIFGSISGGSALKFGVYPNAETGEWMGPGEKKSKPIAIGKDAAIAIARRHRDEILRGTQLLEALPASASDEEYRRLQKALNEQCPSISDTGWGHKYFSLLFPTKLDDYHAAHFQRFHLIHMLQPNIPPALEGRFVTAGRYVALAQELGMPLNHLTTVINARRNKPFGYWRVKARTESGWPSWEEMLHGQFVGMGWDGIGDLSDYRWVDEDSNRLRKRMQDLYGVSGPAATSLFYFATLASIDDRIVVEQGQEVLAIGQIVGDYYFDTEGVGKHRRRVRWLFTERWTVQEEPLGKYDFRAIDNNFNLGIDYRVGIERRILDNKVELPSPPVIGPTPPIDPIVAPQAEPLTGMAAKIAAVLERKGQVILYGPPGTGKTYWALSVAKDLVSHARHGRPHNGLSEAERAALEPILKKAIHVVTFHPGYGYEDFIEGYRPESTGDAMQFNLRDGLFKRLAQEAAANLGQKYFLIIDEINRGDIPRIFGELLTLLEKEKRNQTLTLPVSGKPFSVPPNLYVIGTMNTADRSIALLDTALRRRFGFIELMPDYGKLRPGVLEGIPLASWLKELNSRILTSVGRDARNLQIGHAYLMNRGVPVADFETFARLLQEDIIPLLEEYAYEDYSVLESILGRGMVDTSVQRIRHELFEPEHRDDLVSAILEPTPDLSTTTQVVTAKERKEQLEPEGDKDE